VHVTMMRDIQQVKVVGVTLRQSQLADNCTVSSKMACVVNVGGAEPRQAQLGAPEGTAARAHHRRGYGETRQDEARSCQGGDSETAHSFGE
jgi:hypothetical protein